MIPDVAIPGVAVTRPTLASMRPTSMITGMLLAGMMVGPGATVAQSNVAFPPEVYAGRRARLVAQLDGPIIVPSEYMIRAGGEKKQEANFFYLTGVESPYAILYMEPDGAGGVRDVLFLPSHREFAGAQYSFQDPRLLDSAWNRLIRRLEPGAAAEQATGISETLPLADFTERLRNLTAGRSQIYFAQEGGSLYAPPGMNAPTTLRQQFEASLSEALGGRTFENATPAIERMRVIKDSYEIDALRRAAEVSAEGLLEAMRRIEPGMNDLEVAGIMEWAWKRGGSPRTAFPPIVASGPDAVSLFTIRAENYNGVDRQMLDGDLVFIDYGAAEWDMYGSDVCRTFPVSGRFSDEQRGIYEIVLEAQEAAIAQVRPGARILDVIRAAAGVFQAHGLDANEDIDRMGVDKVWGLMPSPTHYLTQGRGLTQYTAVGGLGVRDIGHHVGLEATDGRDYTTPLEPGMVFTIEPKIYVPELDIAIMIEDVILVTEDGYENLSADAPRTVEDIERIMGAR
jgi:Xaa-Pro aminopeptidase